MRTATEAVLSSLVLCHLLSQPASLIATGRFRAFCAHRWRRYAPTTVSFHLEFRSPRVLQGFAIDRHRPRSRYRSRSSRALEEKWRGEEWKRREREEASGTFDVTRCPFQLVVNGRARYLKWAITLHFESLIFFTDFSLYLSRLGFF